MTIKCKTPDLGARLEAAFRKLPDARWQEGELQAAVSALIALNQVGNTKPPAKFIADDSKTIDELDKLCRLLDRSASQIEAKVQTLHNHSYLALDIWDGRLPGLVSQLRQSADRVKETRSREQERIGPIQPPTPVGGRPPDKRVSKIAEMIAIYFERFSGERPTLTIGPRSGTNEPSGPFYVLICEVFDILGVVASAEHYARQICSSQASQKPRRKPPQS